MRAHILKAIKDEWGKISSSEQRYLIYQYIEGSGTEGQGSWMEFLQDYFEISATPPLKGFCSTREAVC